MENNERDIQRELTRIQTAPASKHKQQWTVLFVGEHGEVRRIHRFRAWVIFFGLLFTAAVATAAWLFVIYQAPQKENRQLRAELTMVREQLNRLASEKDLLLARLVLMESRIEEAGAKQADAGSDNQTPPGTPTETGNAASQPAEASPASSVANQGERAGAADASTGDGEEPPPGPVVDVKELRVSHEPATNMLQAQFMLRKADTEKASVSGRTFVILMDDAYDSQQWLTMPQVPLTNGRPARIRNGRYFSISRFNIVKFSTPVDESPVVFSRAIVLVYALDGELILEKPFDISITVPPSAVGEESSD